MINSGSEPIANRIYGKDDFNLGDFIDNTENYKGNTYRLRFTIDYNHGETLRDRIGGSVQLYCYSNGVDTKLEINVDIPDGLSVPRAACAEDVWVTFKCTEGSLSYGNIASSIER